MYENYLTEKLDEIHESLDKFDWINSYTVFIQLLKTLDLKSFDEDVSSFSDHLTMGYTIQAISRRNKLVEISSALSTLEPVKDLKEPKSTENSIPINHFPPLKQPPSTSIPGDFSNTIDIEANPNFKILEGALSKASEYQIPFSHNITVDLETRLISNGQRTILSENALRTNYQVSTQFEIHGMNYNLSRSSMSRSLNLKVEEPITSLVNATITRIKSSPVKINPDVQILFHPESYGSFIARTFSQGVLGEGTQFTDELQVYDDPLRNGGYFSTLFDDEGELTRPKQLIANGEHVNDLIDHRTSNWMSGGNGYRVSWFQPRVRSYSHKVIPSITNLVLSGGTGKGQHFTDRPGKLLYIRQGYSFNLTSSSDFILHVNEAEIWQDGDLLGPVHNVTIKGNLAKLLSEGHFSSDEVSVVNPTVPGSVYCGWIALPPSTVEIRS